MRPPRSTTLPNSGRKSSRKNIQVWWYRVCLLIQYGKISHDVLEEIIKGAKERLVLVSPYLKFNARVKELLSDGYRPDVEIRIVYGKREPDARERQWLNTVPHVRTSFCRNLHPKCYLNEHLCIISSLNLHLFSQQNN